MQAASAQTTRPAPTISRLGRGRVRVLFVVDHDAVVTFAAAVSPEQARLAAATEFQLIEKGVVEVFGGIDWAARFQHQHFHSRFGESHGGPSAAGSRSHYNCVVSYGHR